VKLSCIVDESSAKATILLWGMLRDMRSVFRFGHWKIWLTVSGMSELILQCGHEGGVRPEMR